MRSFRPAARNGPSPASIAESRLLAEAPGTRRLVALAVAAGLVSAGLVVVEALLLSAVVAAAFLGARPVSTIPGLLVAIVVIVMARLPLGLGAEWLGEAAAARLTDTVRTRLTDGLLAAGPVMVGRERRGELVSVVVGGLDAVADLVAVYRPARWLAVGVPLLILVVVAVLDPLSTLVLLVTGPVLVLLLAVIGGRAGALTRRRFDDMRWLGAFFLDVVGGIATLKMFGRSAEQVDTIQRLGRRYSDTSMEVLRTAFQTSFVLEWGASIAVAVVAVEVSLRLMTDAIDFERALAILVITPAFFLPLRRLAGQYHVGTAGRAAAERIVAILDETRVADDRGSAAVGASAPATDDRPVSIHVGGMSVGYPDRSVAALDGIDLDVPAGELVAIVGSTGAGKSTLLSVLLRFLEATAGQAAIDGRPLATIHPRAWRASVAWVPQAPHLLHATVEDNLRLARPDATADDLAAATRDAGADAFIAALPRGLATIVGPGGHGLSGGEVRRLAIARGLLAAAPLLILDEPTADLDPAAATRIHGALAALRGTRTILVATHDRGLMDVADRIVVLEAGRVIAAGPPRDVLQVLPTTISITRPGAAADGADPEPSARRGDAARDLPTDVADEDTATPGRPVLRRLVGLLRPQRRWLAIGAGLGLLVVVANVALAGTSAYLISRAAIATNVADVALAVTAVRVLAISRAAFRYLERLVTHRATFEVLTTIRTWFYRSIEPLAPARLAGVRSGDLLARIGADVDTLETFPARVLLPPVVAIGVVGVGALLLGSFDPMLGLALLIGSLIAGLGVPIAVRRAARGVGDAAIVTRAELSAAAVDLVTAVRDLAVLDREQRHRSTMLGIGRELDRLRLRGGLLRTGGEASTVLVAGLTGAAVLAIGVGLVAAGRLDGVALAVVTLAAIACFEAFGPVAQAVELLPRHERAAARLFDLVDVPPAVVDPVRPAPRPISHDLDIRRLSFAYDGGPLALDDVSLSMPAGGRLAVVGPSGAGKSTIANLLLRFWDYDRGEIRVDGRDLHEYRIDEVRTWFGVVDQRVHLFNGTIRDNLAVADADATDADMEHACRIAQLHEFIAELPRGYGARIGHDGVQLSGGQRQQLAVARMVLKAAPIVVLDEATAHLDETTEGRLLEALEPFLARRTVLWISHRAAISRYVDQVVRLDHGRVVGGPVSLIRTRPLDDGGGDESRAG